jgi:hypothetical protein
LSLQAELEEKYRRYSETLGKALSTLKLKGSGRTLKVRKIVHLAKCYHEDAGHFHGKQMLITALVSLAYGEGLLDALKMLDFVDFQWGERIGEER